MKKTLVLVCALAPLAASAQEAYVAGTLGQSRFEIGKSELDASLRSFGAANLSSSSKDRDTVVGAGFGYQFNPYVAAELGYMDLGKTMYSASYTGGNLNAEIRARGWTLSALGLLPIVDMVSIYGRIGMFTGNVEGSVNATGPGAAARVSAGEKDTSPIYGIGLQITPVPRFGIRAEYIRFDRIGADAVGSGDVRLWSIGMFYKF